MSAEKQRAGARRGRPGADTHAASVPVRGRVSEIQRARILSAAVEVTRERGADAMTVARVVARAGLSRRTFYELFEDREDCFLAAFDDAIARVSARVLAAYVGEKGWRERIRAGLTALLEFFDEEPGLGALLVVDALRAGPGALERRAGILRVLIEAVDGGRVEGRIAQERPLLTAEGVVGSVFSVIHARMLECAAGAETADHAAAGHAASGHIAGDVAGAREPLVALVNPLMGMIVLPYFGNGASKRELHRPVASPARAPRPRVDPLKDLDMRLTYRTVRVLMAIATAPGASNRQVAQAAGVTDPGQMSKLLTRLDNLGLIHNSGAGYPKGEPNAWQLTTKGEEVEQAIRIDTGGG
jgi:AcrR family transcriptional regulator